MIFLNEISAFVYSVYEEQTDFEEVLSLVSFFTCVIGCNRTRLHLNIKINTHDENPGEESTCSSTVPLKFHSLQRFGTKGL